MNTIEKDRERINVLGWVIGIGLIILLIASLIYTLDVGMNRQEIVDCNTWKQYAEEYPNFFLTQWQAEQCKAHNIIINAPIK